jgi:hypothetical protein
MALLPRSKEKRVLVMFGITALCFVGTFGQMGPCGPATIQGLVCFAGMFVAGIGFLVELVRRSPAAGDPRSMVEANAAELESKRRSRWRWSGLLALVSIAAAALFFWLMVGQLGPCGPASARGAIAFYGFMLSFLIASGSTIFFLRYCLLAVARRLGRSKASAS